MSVHQIASPYLRLPLTRSEAQAADDQARERLRWAKRLRRVTCTDRQGQPAGIDRRALMLAEAEMRDGTGERAFFALTCGAQRLEPAPTQTKGE